MSKKFKAPETPPKSKVKKIPSITVCVPCYRDIDTDVVNGILAMDTTGFDIKLKLVKNLNVDTARNLFAEKVTTDYLLFIDSDVIPPPNTLKQLITADKDIISGLYFRRKWPYPPIIMQRRKGVEGMKNRYSFMMEYPRNMVVECDGIGMGICLIKTDVFKKIKPPWFVHNQAMTEDLAFCELAKESGYKIFVDTGLIGTHIDTIKITEWVHETAKRDIFLFKARDMGESTFQEMSHQKL